MAECPICNRDFKNEIGVRSHASQTHNENPIKKSVEYECDYCSTVFEREPSLLNANEKNFCDKECHRKWQSECRPTEEHNWYKGGPAIVECVQCGDELERRPCKLERSEKFYCSVECESAHKTGRLTKENHPNWKGGVRYDYGSNWHEQRAKRLEIDDDQCVICEKSNAQEKIDTGSALTVHHIRPIREFADTTRSVDYEAANRIENLITLCKSCHRRWEGIPLRPDIRGDEL